MMDINSTDHDIIPIEDSNVEQSTVTDSDNFPTIQKESFCSKHQSFIRICTFATFTSISMTIGILTVYLTLSKETDKTCQINFERTIQHEMGYDSHPRHVVLGNFNKDNYLDIVVANSGTDSIGIFFGFKNETFTNQTTYSTEHQSRPYSIAVGDFNNDTALDVVVANYGTNSIGLLLGDGNGSFATPIITTLGSSHPRSLVVADFNNDRKLDIAVLNYGTSSISILLAYNDKSFQINQTIDMGYDSFPYSLVVSDFNKDNRIDIAIVNYGTDNLAILFANNNGTFISHTYSTGHGSHPSSLAIGDYNNDNTLDIAVTNSGTNTVGIFLGYGNRTFANIIIQSVDSLVSPQFISVSDFDKDNVLDMIVANTGGDNVLVLKGYGNGSFSVSTTHLTGYSSGSCFIVVGDFGNNNQSDIAIANMNTNNIIVLSGFAIYPNTTQKTYSTGTKAEPYSIAVGHLTNDSHLDIVVAYAEINYIGIFFGLGNGSFKSQQLIFAGAYSFPSFVAINDFNNDGQNDIVVVRSTGAEIAILLGDKNETFIHGNTYSTGDNSLPLSAVVARLNNDNNLDIISANYQSNNIGIFYGYGDGNFTNVTTFFIRNDFYPNSMSVGDFNSDNILDIIVSNREKNDIAIFLGWGNKSFSISLIISTNDGYTPNIAIGDLNKDNHLDIVYTSPLISSIGVRLGSANATFGNLTRYYTGDGFWPWSITLYDFNNDSKLDIAISNAYGYNIGLFFGYGNGLFGAQKTFSTGYGSRPTSIAFGDFNGDNQPDLVVGNQDGNSIGVFLLQYDADFARETSYLTGSGPHPYSVAVGDFDSDGQSDIVVANPGNNAIQILLDYKQGAFMKNKTYSTGPGSYPQFVTVADFNQDTQLDIAVADTEKNNINIFAGFGNGTFNTATVHSIGSGSIPSSIAVGDLNNDSWMDLVIANQGKDNVGVLFGFDYPTFTNQTILISGPSPQPFYIAVGDFNHDHHWDIVVANFAAFNVDVFIGYGNGTFSERMAYSTGPLSQPVSIAIADFNNDTHLDIVVTNSNTKNIGIFLGYGNGSFQTQVTYATGNPSLPTSVAVGDLNQDNRLDIVVTNTDSNTIGVFLGRGNGTFADQVLYRMLNGSAPRWVAIGDVNSDNLSDIVVANNGKNNIGILFGYGDGTFQNVTMLSTGANSGPFSIAIGDLNGDKWIDIAVANKGTKNVGVFFGYGNGTFSGQTTYFTGYQSDLLEIIIDDLNKDTTLDIAVVDWGNGNGNIGILYGYGDGNFTVLKTYSTGLNSNPTSIAVCDFDSDGRVDLAMSYYNKDSIGIMLRYKSEPFATVKTFSTGNYSSPRSVAIGDFNNDAQLDIAVANSGTDNIGIFLGYGNGTFTQQQTYSTGNDSNPISIAVGYINNDTQLDIIVANSKTNNIVIILGTHNGTFVILTTYSTGQSSAPSSIAVRDLNKDNHLDIVVSALDADQLFVFFGIGNGTFLDPKPYSLDYNARPQSVAIADFNNDSLLDIAVANFAADYVEILLRTC